MPALTRNSLARSGVSCLVKALMSAIFFFASRVVIGVAPFLFSRLHISTGNFNQICRLSLNRLIIFSPSNQPTGAAARIPAYLATLPATSETRQAACRINHFFRLLHKACTFPLSPTAHHITCRVCFSGSLCFRNTFNVCKCSNAKPGADLFCVFADYNIRFVAM